MAYPVAQILRESVVSIFPTLNQSLDFLEWWMQKIRQNNNLSTHDFTTNQNFW